MDGMKKVLVLAAVGEAATGMALLVVPSLVGQLLLGSGLTGIAIPVARVAGIALVALGLACRPGNEATGAPTRAMRAMMCYGFLVTLYLAYLGIRGAWVGVLLWPAVTAHVVLTCLLARAWVKDRRTRE